ncbi:mannose-6-phosphate isomerase, class I [Kocuria sp. M1R5S2]|uniref:mannose-6-phosphate isomerase, class I n=1 Tax=Kocuria rhizosphaerae TaxID=3376285 RepID=UPI003793A651
MHLLRNTVRPYPWGSPTAIADLLGRAPGGGPEAELWIGAHSDSPSVAVRPEGDPVPLDALIAEDPVHHLGRAVHERFGGHLPFLVKVLAAESALSLQVHPTREQAAAGYAAENAAGIPAGAPHRNYKDANHKPEMILALTTFEALCGFRPPEESSAVFAGLAELLPADSEESLFLATVAADLRSGDRPSAVRQERSPGAGLRAAFSRLATERRSAGSALAAVTGLSGTGGSALEQDLRTVAELDAEHPGDPGVLIALLLNRVALRPGQALYLPAGNIHAYLHGLGIEVMASSDNVLRGGLTTKHVDVPELLKTVVFEPLAPPVLAPERTAPGQELFRPPFEEFQLQLLRLEPGTANGRGAPSRAQLVQEGPVVVLAVTGDVDVQAGPERLTLPRGESVFVPAAESPVVLSAGSSDAPAGGTLAVAVTVARGAAAPPGSSPGVPG